MYVATYFLQMCLIVLKGRRPSKLRLHAAFCTTVKVAEKERNILEGKCAQRELNILLIIQPFLYTINCVYTAIYFFLRSV